MLRNARGFGISRTFGGPNRLSLTKRQNEKRFCGNSFFIRHRLITSKQCFRQFSILSGSSSIWFQDLGVRSEKTNQSHLTPSSEDDNFTHSRVWIVKSPSSVLRSGIFDRIVRWLRACFFRLSKFSLLVMRAGEVIIHLSPLIILAPSAFFSNWVFESPIISNIAWKYTIKTIQRLGPVAVKFCQWAATRRDIFHPALCDQLSILYDSGYPHAFQWTNQILTEAFGDYKKKGLVIEDLIGCGSAAQVYRGKLTVEAENMNSERCQSTREVAIKVLHPRFREMVDRDLDFIQTTAGFVHSLPFEYIKMMNLPRAVDEFSTVLYDQVDLTIEAENLRQFRKNFRNESDEKEEVSSVVFPQPLSDWTSSQVIVEEYISNAVPIRDYLRDSSQEGMQRRREIAAPLLRAFLKMVFVDNFIHGDLHPGNVLVKTTVVSKPLSPWSIFSNFKSNKEEKIEEEKRIKRSIVFLDAGIVVSLSPNDKKNLFDLFRAVVFNDGKRAGRLMVERAKYERCSQNPYGIERFSEGIEEIVTEFHDRRKEGLTLGAVRIGVLLNRVLDLCRIYGVEIDPAMASVVISTLVLEGLGRSLSPDLDLLTFARPFLMNGK